MRLPNTYMDRSGFTVIEILLALGVLTILVSTGSIIGLESYHRQIFNQQEQKIIALLYQTRTNALNNLNGQAQGIRFAAGQATTFQGLQYEDLPHTHQTYDFSVIPDTTKVTDIIFLPLDAQVNQPTSIKLSKNGQTITLTINQEGQITW